MPTLRDTQDIGDLAASESGVKHELEYVEPDDDKGYEDGLDDVYRCTCGETFQANGDVVDAFQHGLDVGLEMGRSQTRCTAT